MVREFLRKNGNVKYLVGPVLTAAVMIALFFFGRAFLYADTSSTLVQNLQLQIARVEERTAAQTAITVRDQAEHRNRISELTERVKALEEIVDDMNSQLETNGGLIAENNRLLKQLVRRPG